MPPLAQTLHCDTPQSMQELQQELEPGVQRLSQQLTQHIDESQQLRQELLAISNAAPRPKYGVQLPHTSNCQARLVNNEWDKPRVLVRLTSLQERNDGTLDVLI